MLLGPITLRNLLSFRDQTVALGPLNILIGENTAGKSNLIEAIGLLQAAPSDFRAAILRGGGIRSWLWQGEGVRSNVAEVICEAGAPPDERSLYTIEFAEDAGGLAILSESLTDITGKIRFFARSDQSLDFVGARGYPVGRTDSVLAQFKNPGDETPTTRLGRLFEKIQIDGTGSRQRELEAWNARVFWMVEVMESWFLADCEGLKRYYARDFRESALPPNPQVERISKRDVLDGLKEATKKTQIR